MNRLYYRKLQRVASQQDFGRVLGHRCVVRRGSLRLYGAPNGLAGARFGVSVSRSCGGAVQRNRLKRLAREVFRTNQYKIGTGVDYVLIFSPPKSGKSKQPAKALEMDYKELESTLLEMMQSVQHKCV